MLIWEDAVEIAARESGIDEFPQQLPWNITDALDSAFLPEL